MSEEEFEKQTLNNLITELKDIDKYTSFKNGAFIYDLGKYQGTLLVEHIEQLQQENKQLKEQLDVHKILLQTNAPSTCILTELEDYLEKEWNITSRGPKGSFYEGYDTCMLEMKEDIQNKIQELKEKYK